jgi:hypothetical protein
VFLRFSILIYDLIYQIFAAKPKRRAPKMTNVVMTSVGKTNVEMISVTVTGEKDSLSR